MVPWWAVHGPRCGILGLANPHSWNGCRGCESCPCCQRPSKRGCLRPGDLPRHPRRRGGGQRRCPRSERRHRRAPRGGHCCRPAPSDRGSLYRHPRRRGMGARLRAMGRREGRGRWPTPRRPRARVSRRRGRDQPGLAGDQRSSGARAAPGGPFQGRRECAGRARRGRAATPLG
jgi:hypothetical protein